MDGVGVILLCSPRTCDMSMNFCHLTLQSKERQHQTPCERHLRCTQQKRALGTLVPSQQGSDTSCISLSSFWSHFLNHCTTSRDSEIPPAHCQVLKPFPRLQQPAAPLQSTSHGLVLRWLRSSVPRNQLFAYGLKLWEGEHWSSVRRYRQPNRSHIFPCSEFAYESCEFRRAACWGWSHPGWDLIRGSCRDQLWFLCACSSLFGFL